MASDEVRYTTKTVHTVRGAEARAKTKWQQAGWEFVEQTPDSMLRTKLTFRKPAPKQPPLLLLAGAGVLLIAGLGVAALLEDDDQADQPAAAPTAAATVESSETDTEASSAQPDPATETSPADTTEATESAGDTPSSDPAPSTTGSEQTLTVDNSPELATLLREPEPGSPVVETFAADHDDALLEFDANIASLSPHDDYKTRFDLLIAPGDYSETSQTGPTFIFRDVNIVSDLKLNGPGIPDSLGVGQNIRIIARVDVYNPTQQLFFLEPVSTQIR